MSKVSKREKEIYKVTIVGSVVNFLLLVFKFVAGILGNSAAMVADAVHSLSDFVTDVIVVVFVRISGKPEDKCHAYGHGKFETLATAVIGIILFFVGLGMFYSAATTIVDVVEGKTLEAPGMLALVAAVLSVLLKELLYRYTVYKGKNLDSQVVIANAWHHRSDAFSSIGTLVGISGAVF
ncbi:MAG: cation transporter, partial [Bacteroidaceae bacterium]|nr:cation transporter [Bacteroidaceae bacterium]